LVIAHLFIHPSLPGESEAIFLFFELIKATTCYYQQSNPSKAEAIPLSALSKDTASKLAGLPSQYPFNTKAAITNFLSLLV